MTDPTQADHAASRRTLLLCAGLAGAGGAGVLPTGCSPAAVPYDANEEGQAPGPQLAVAPASTPAAAASATSSPTAGSGGIVLGQTADIPLGGGTVFTDAQVVGTPRNRAADGPLDSPRRGSKFKISDGAVVAGPAPTALAAAPITVADGK